MPAVVNQNDDLLYNPTQGYGVSFNNPLPQSPIDKLEQGITSFTGSDLRIIVELAPGSTPPDPSSGNRLSKQIIECTTLTVSVHRVKSPVRALSYINPKGFARGGRTIAGTLVMTQFTLDVLYKFLQATLWNDISKDTTYVKVDQIPPLNFTMVFSDEFGNCSYRRLLGVDIIDDGTIYSMNDMFTEQTLVYQASDFTPLLPFSLSAITPGTQNRDSAKSQTTPGTKQSLLNAQRKAGTGNLITTPFALTTLPLGRG